MGKSTIDVIDANGFAVAANAVDFILKRGVLNFEPVPGDTITYDGDVYEVLPISPEGCWRWCDGYKTAIRVHTKRKAGTQ